MIARLRTPWLAALLLLASPALGGLVMPVLHPCQAEASGTGTSAGHHGHGDHGSQGEQDGTGGQQCTCVGSCHVPALDAAPRVHAPVAVFVPTADHEPRVTPRTAARLPRQPLDLLPPTTAPPLG